MSAHLINLDFLRLAGIKLFFNRNWVCLKQYNNCFFPFLMRKTSAIQTGKTGGAVAKRKTRNKEKNAVTKPF